MSNNGNGGVRVVMLEESGFQPVAEEHACVRRVRESYPDCEVIVCIAAALAGRTLADIERQAILDTLHACKGNKAATARALGVCEKTIYNKLKRIRAS